MDQLLAGNGAEGVGNGSPAGCAVARAAQEVHLQGSVVLLFQVVPHFSELWKLEPAGLGGAASRHAMTFTRLLHGALHSLIDKQRL